MSYIELYNKDILDVVSIGKILSGFDEISGDYIKVEVFDLEVDFPMETFYSNRLLLKTSTNDYYLGNYHFHPENMDMGFCSGRTHTTDSISNLQPIPLGNSLNEPLNSETKYQKQFDIFKDDEGEIYIKPNEIIKLINAPEGKYKIRIHFLRNIKSTLGSFLGLNKNNLIENGNFFAGLEATQTGDLDRSVGRNNFIIMDNPGFGKYVLEQDGIGSNIYNMRITGVELNTNYVFSCWVAWNNNFNGSYSLVSFENTLGTNFTMDEKTDFAGSWTDNEDKDNSRILSTKNNFIIWERLFSKVYINVEPYSNSININLGSVGNFQTSSNPLSRRYFTDLRFEKVENFDAALITYLNKLKEDS